ncbi:MAG: hypothetical protein ABFD89_21715 [Bryobacteraceae bacterium]
MADFRKWIPVLAVVALLVGATSVNAQLPEAQTFQCTANAGVTPLVRAEGIAELVGDLLLNCSGTVPTGGITSNIRIFANTTVTSKIAGGPLPSGSEALLLINDPAPAAQIVRVYPSIDNSVNPNVFQGANYAANVVDWYSIPIATAAEAGTTVTKTLRITDIRANAAQLGVSSTLIPQPIQLSISISGATSVGVNNPTQTVAWVQKGLTFSAQDGITHLRQCEPRPFGEPIVVTFTEGFASAFKAQGDSTQQNPGTSYNTESGLIPAGLAAYSLATQGTRFMAVFTNVPTGITLTAEGNFNIPSTGLTVQSVSGADENGNGGTVSGADIAFGTGGTITFVWEVTAAPADSIGRNEIVDFNVTPSWSISSPPAGGTTMTVRGNYAPISTITTASHSAPLPRFQDTSSAITGGAITIEPCRTVLLFPYVTNAAGFDTGIAISNTSMDPFDASIVPDSVALLKAVPAKKIISTGSVEQSGTCQLNYYGNTPATGGEAPDAVTTPEIGAGEQLAFIVSSGGAVVGTTKTCVECATPGFHGYVIAICDFQYAHGFAFVSDLGSAKLAEGYLALVIPDRGTRGARAFSYGAHYNDAEQLAY